MHFKIEQRDNIVIFTLNSQSIDSDISAELKAKILIVAQPDIDALIIDLANVDYIDSSGLGALLLAHRQLNEHSIPVLLIGVQETVRKMLNISHLEDLFEYYEDVDEALAELEE